MENLIDFDEPESKPMQRNINKVFGIIRQDCFAANTGIEDGCSETLKPGTLIQIIPDYGGSGCHFMIWDFSNLLDKYKTTIYKCLRDDYIVVKEELWPYLLSMENDENQRIKFVQNVYSRKFNLNMVKLGNEIRIRWPLRNKVDHYYEFIVTHNGVVKEQGTGYYIGLRLKNEFDSLTSNLKVFSRHYRFGGKGIVVSVDFIMLNLYKEEYQPQSCIDAHVENSSGEVFTINSVTPKQISETNGISKSRNFSSEKVEIKNVSNDANEIVCRNKACNHIWFNPTNAPKNNARCPKCNTNWCFICSNSHEPGERHGSNSGQMRTENKGTEEAESNVTVKKEVEQSSTIIEKSNIKTETGAIPKTRRLSHETPNEINLFNPPNRMLVKCNLCSRRIVIGSKIHLSQCLHEYCKQCITQYIERNSKNSLIRCPYNKEYVCKINLLDNEIKKFGGEFVYKKILDNRLKESRGADPNARVCSNEACRNIWMSPQNKLVNYERCSKCKTCWCCICSSVHEPGERHGINSGQMRTENKGTEEAELNSTVKRRVERSSTITEKPNLKTETGAIRKTRRFSHETPSEINLFNPPNRMLVKCNLCSRRIVIGSKIYLSQCLHEYCKQCITKYIERNSKNSLIRCPYNKEYVCKINLLDNEIKKFGGEFVYKKILDNRLKESRGADPNARVCSNEACRNIWMSPQNKLVNYERCSKCKTCWCCICSSVHEPGERHGKNLGNTRSVIEVPKTELGVCAKCRKSKIAVNGCDTVQNCNHKFCSDCIVPMVKTRTSGSQNAECVICRNQTKPEEDKVTKKTGFAMLEQFLHDRDNKQQNANQMKLCCCIPPAQNCFFTLKCKHQFCRTFLMNILPEQHQRISRAACPSCFEEIDDYEIKRLVDQMKTEFA